MSLSHCKRYTLTWLQFTQQEFHGYDQIEDPALSTPIPIETFISIYKPLLELLDGSDMSAYLDFYFISSPINPFYLHFIGDNERLDFQEEAIEMGLIPKLKEIMEGEDECDKLMRKEKEEKEKHSRQIQQEKSLQRKKENKTMAHRKQTLLDTLEKWMIKLKEETDPEMRRKIGKKIERTNEMLQKSA